MAFGKHGDLSKGGGVQVLAGGGVAYPNPTDGGLYLSPVWVHEPAGPTIRGRLRGFWQLCHLYSGFTDGETFTGTGDLAGRTFTVMRQSANNGAYCIETSATLETN